MSPRSLLRIHPAVVIWLVALVFSLVGGCAGGSVDDESGDVEAGEPDAGIAAAPEPDGGGEPADEDADAAPEEPADDEPDAAPEEPAGALTATQQALFDAINAERVAAGLDPVALREDLTCAAQAHSDDIGVAGVCAVVGTDGSTIEDRVVACAGPSVAAALVGCGYLSGTATASGWAGDAGTRAILMDPALKFVGVGEHARYWTAVFDR